MSRRLERARALLGRPGAWLAADGDDYALRIGPKRSQRAVLVIDEAGFRALVEAPGLSPRPGGGWTARAHRDTAPGPPPGRPGMVEGRRAVMHDGRLVERRSNLGVTAIAWLASRRDGEGRPWLAPAEIAAGARLTDEAEAALRGPSLTMRWDALPRSGGGSAARVEPSRRALIAARRVEAALVACGPARGMIEAVCLRSSALTLAERDLGLRRHSGRAVLKAGLQALARHYRIG